MGIQPVYEKKDYSFVNDMMEGVLRRKMKKSRGTTAQFFDPPAKAMQKNIAPVENPGKDVVTARHLQRFPQQQANTGQ